VQNTINSLEADTLSDDDDGHSEVKVLDRVAAANIIALRNQQDANKLLVTLAEQRALETKRTRDSEAQALNEQVSFIQNVPAVMAEQTRGLTSAMTSYSLP
jgi:adenine-specific DNA methylase